MYDRAVSDSNFLRMSSNARLIMKTTGTNHGRQEVEKKQEANHGANRFVNVHYSFYCVCRLIKSSLQSSLSLPIVGIMGALLLTPAKT